jgi:dolichol-phosphate mannosyltransferase
VIVVMLPAYNESSGLPDLIAGLARSLSPTGGRESVLLIDDGSTDGTAGAARDAAARAGIDLEVVTPERHLGLGAALRTGLRRADEILKGEGALVVMDADDTHDPALVPAMLEKLALGLDVVIASRYAPGGREVGLSRLRSLLSRGASLTMRIFLPVPGARDYSCGYRAYSGRILARALEAYGDGLIEEPGFVATTELLVKISRLPARVGEVPLVLRYDRKGGASKMRIADTIARTLRLAFSGRRAARPRVGAAGGRRPARGGSARKEGLT